jgi:hypothetical protein
VSESVFQEDNAGECCRIIYTRVNTWTVIYILVRDCTVTRNVTLVLAHPVDVFLLRIDIAPIYLMQVRPLRFC